MKTVPPLLSLALLKKNNNVPLFIPVGCTDVLQECDTVVNKPFKKSVQGGYLDHMQGLFDEHKRSGSYSKFFTPKLTMGALKPAMGARAVG